MGVISFALPRDLPSFMQMSESADLIVVKFHDQKVVLVFINSSSNLIFLGRMKFQVLFVKEAVKMLGWTITFLIIALIAALFGFAGIAGAAAGIAKILFIIFLVLFVLSLLFGRRRSI